MKKFKVEYLNHCILFGDNKFSVVVEAEDETRARGKAKYEKRDYVIEILSVDEI